ncbi:MAG: type II toxin-antitoxin system RelE/ParE family toxin [Verrucomicrobiota bacterium]
MHTVNYHRRALKSLKQIPAARATQILNAIDHLASLADPASDANVKKMHGPFEGSFRTRIGDYRVIFEIRKTGEPVVYVLLVTHNGARGSSY